MSPHFGEAAESSQIQTKKKTIRKTGGEKPDLIIVDDHVGNQTAGRNRPRTQDGLDIPEP